MTNLVILGLLVRFLSTSRRILAPASMDPSPVRLRHLRHRGCPSPDCAIASIEVPPPNGGQLKEGNSTAGAASRATSPSEGTRYPWHSQTDIRNQELVGSGTGGNEGLGNNIHVHSTYKGR
jgi:hypothetical protein